MADAENRESGVTEASKVFPRPRAKRIPRTRAFLPGPVPVPMRLIAVNVIRQADFLNGIAADADQA